MGKIIGFKHGEDSIDKVDPRLWDIVQHAIAVMPYDAQIRSGSERTGGKGNHKHGYAVDVTFIDKNGNKIPDIGRNAESAKIYEQYAQAARVYQQANYPELEKTFRWGGGFKQGAEFDFMHLDITPARGGSMAYYNWDTGFNGAARAAIPGLDTSSGLSDPRLRRQYELAFENAGEVLPPLNMPGVASATDTAPPVPMPGRPASLATTPRPAFSSTFGATAGDMESAPSRLATTTLGWEDGAATWNGTDIRAPIPRSSYARARLEAGNMPGGVADPRIASLLQPQQETVPLPRSRPPIAPVPMPGRPPTIDMVADPDEMIGLGNGVGFGPGWDTLNTLKDISAGVYDRPAPPVPMPGRPAFPSAPSAPVPMPGRPGALNNAAPPSVPAPRNDSAPAQQSQEMVRLPSGKMAPLGTQVNPATGNTITISRGPDGMGVVKIHRSGFIDIGSEMNAPTLAGAFIRSKIPEAAQSAVNNFGPALDSVKSSAVSAINTVAPTFQGLGNTVGGMFGGLMGMLPGSAPPKVPGSAFTGGWGSRPPAPMPFMPSPMLRSNLVPDGGSVYGQPTYRQAPSVPAQRRPAPRNTGRWEGVLDEFGMII